MSHLRTLSRCLVLSLAACSPAGHLGDVASGSDGLTKASTRPGELVADPSERDQRALAGCELYWRRLKGEQSTPDMPEGMVEYAVVNVAKYLPAPGESPLRLRVGVPGGITSDGDHAPHPDYIDPWEQQYELVVYSNGSAQAISAGADATFETGDDIAYPAEPSELIPLPEAKSGAEDEAQLESGGESVRDRIHGALAVFLGVAEGEDTLLSICGSEALRGAFSISGDTGNGFKVSGKGSQSLSLGSTKITARGIYDQWGWEVEVTEGATVTFRAGDQYRFTGEGWVLDLEDKR